MLSCEKRRHVIKRARDGSEVDMYRCANMMANTYSQQVTPKMCQQCVLRVGSVNNLCGQPAPFQPIYLQPIYGSQLEIIYQPGAVPTCPHGYRPDPENLWTFVSEWVACPQRVFNNTLNELGEVVINAVCGLANKPVSCGECKSCGSKVPDFPKLSTQLANYGHAIKQWIGAGRPERTDEEVKQIHEDFCIKCDWYDNQRCRGCGCKVSTSSMAIFNKIKMTTEHCPRQLW